jgi:hypothetical protein
MIVVYGGRRIDAPDAARQFPLTHVRRVAHEIDRALQRLGAAAVVGSAACGADLLVVESARRVGVRCRIVLPFGRAAFRLSSVVDRPGDWGARFDAAIANAADTDDLVELDASPGDTDAYRRANDEMIRQAVSMATGSSDQVALLVAWNGASHGDDDVTAALLAEAHRRGWRVAVIDTA